MSLFDIYKAKKLGAGAGSLFDAIAGKKLSPVESFNKWDEEWETGAFVDGLPRPDSSRIRSKNFCECLPDTKYAKRVSAGVGINLFWYDAEQNFISYDAGTNTSGLARCMSPANAAFFKLCTTTANGGTYHNDICINISGDRDGEYQPHGKP